MKRFAPFALRVAIGGIFLVAGILKVMNPPMVTGMLDSMGFPGPALWAWILIMAELVCGAAVLAGFKVKWTTVPLAVVMIVALAVSDPMFAMGNISILAGLVSLWLSGPGAWALDRQ